ncbi:MAG: tRNA (guanosine(46)-N7)-methyltransferase TrmB [Halieaceae bacterium]|nr:tRNA (guanosine(46)-N7)-methyltransferase TrmB [Halieaceae bacterium]
MVEDQHGARRRVRSFVLRAGRMTTSQQRGLDQGWERWGVDCPAQRAPIDLDALFGGPGPRVLEIGFGMGQSLLEMAGAAPDLQFIGVEVHRPGVGKLLAGMEARSIDNIRVFCHDAVEVLDNALAENSLERINIYFPDPWHKKRHHKRRLIQPAFVDLLASRLRSATGILHLATDWQPYAEHMLEVMEASAHFENCAGPAQYSPRPDERPRTKFEARGERLGHGVWDLLYRRRDTA